MPHGGSWAKCDSSGVAPPLLRANIGCNNNMGFSDWFSVTSASADVIKTGNRKIGPKPPDFPSVVSVEEWTRSGRDRDTS